VAEPLGDEDDARSAGTFLVQVGVEVDVAANHVEGRMAEDPVEAEEVASVEQVELGERVSEGVRVGPHAVEPGPPAEPATSG
jgi:hypothetical protein